MTTTERSRRAVKQAHSPMVDTEKTPIWLVWTLNKDGRTYLRSVATSRSVANRHRHALEDEMEFLEQTVRVFVEPGKQTTSTERMDYDLSPMIRRIRKWLAWQAFMSGYEPKIVLWIHG